VNGEKRTTGSQANMIGGEWIHTYTSEKCWVVGLVLWPTNGNVLTDWSPYHNITVIILCNPNRPPTILGRSYNMLTFVFVPLHAHLCVCSFFLSLIQSFQTTPRLLPGHVWWGWSRRG
jgi:hypothetical protein